MATRLDYRTDLSNKFVGIEDSGYGDFDFDTTELNTYLDLSVTRLFPSLYKRVAQSGLSLVGYGTGGYSKVDNLIVPERVYRVEDATELEPILGWRIVGTSVTKLNTWCLPGTPLVNVWYYDAYSLPSDDVTDAGIPAVWRPAIVLGGLIEALESRQDTGVRPDPPSGHQDVTLIDRLANRYDKLVASLAMNAPLVEV